MAANFHGLFVAWRWILLPSTRRRAVSLSGQPAGGQNLPHLVAHALTEAIKDEQQQRARDQADEDHAHPQLADHQQVDPQRQRAEVHLETDSSWSDTWSQR